MHYTAFCDYTTLLLLTIPLSCFKSTNSFSLEPKLVPENEKSAVTEVNLSRRGSLRRGPD